MRNRWNGVSLAGILILFLALSGCGGGGGGETSAPAAPAAPTGVLATPGPTQATVSWDNVTGATSYNLYHSDNAAFTKSTGVAIIGVTSPRTVTGLVNGTIRYFLVTAVGAGGESAESAKVSATPTANPPPAAPTGVSAIKGAASASVSWSAVPASTSYNLYYGTTSPVTKTTGTKLAGVSSGVVVGSLTRGTPYFFVVTAENADGESVESSQVTATPDPPSPVFAQGDLTGIWQVQVILAGNTPGWYRYTAIVNSSGDVTISDPSASSGVSIPSVPRWTIAAGTGFDNTVGVVTETGGGSNTTFHAKMSSSKNVVVGTSTFSTAGSGTYAYHIFLKRTGVTYSNTDLASTTFGYNRIFTGASNIWEIASGSINASNQITLTSAEDSNGPIVPLPPPNFTTVTTDASGRVTIGNEPTFFGMISADKKMIVGTSTDGAGTYSMRIIQMRGQTYSAADIAGAYVIHSYHSDPISSWAYGTWTISATSATAADVTATNITNSDGTFEAGPLTWTYNVDSAGNVTDPANASSRGLVSFGKDMVVHTSDFPGGSSLSISMQ